MTSEFFDYDNKQYYELREQIAQDCLSDLISYINTEENKVAIFDGTNSNKKRRKIIAEQIKSRITCKHQIIFIESVCTNENVVNDNIVKVKLSGQDYRQATSEEALNDFRKRIQFYEKVYETLTVD